MRQKKESLTNGEAIPRQDKDTHSISQEKIVFSYLKTHIATASMVTEATGVVQKNVTRFKSDLENKGLLFELYKGTCKVTGRNKVMYLTCDPEKAPRCKQLSIF